MTQECSTTDSRVAQAIGLYRSIAACDECIARGDDVHAITAALMLPCYQAEFMRVVLELGPKEENELSTALRGSAALLTRQKAARGIRATPVRLE